MQMFRNSPCYGEPIKRGGTAPDFIQYDERFLRGIVKDECCFTHFHHKSGLPACNIITCAHTAENAVYQADVCGVCRYVGAHLRHKGNEGDLTNIRGFAGHVGAGEDENPVMLLVHVHIIGYK